MFSVSVPLSKLYDPDSTEPYIDQVFENVTSVASGTYGHVLKAQDKANGHTYAIKVFIRSPESGYAEAFNHERIISHPNVVQFYLAWEDHFLVHLQMEQCLLSVQEIINQESRIGAPQLFFILTDVGNALKHLHRYGWIHLDVQPGNVMATKAGYYKLGDFGLAINNDKQNIHQRSDTEGNPKYLAAEVLRGIYTSAADIFSLGIMMVELASGKPLPSNGHTWHQLRSGELPPGYATGT